MEHYGFFDGGAEYGQAEFNRYFDKLADGEASSPATAAIHAAATIGIRVVQSPLMLSLLFSTV